MPKEVPIEDLNNTIKLSKLCLESDAPIFLTKAGRRIMVLMSIAVYYRLISEEYAAMLISEVLDARGSRDESLDGDDFFAFLQSMYSKENGHDDDDDDDDNNDVDDD